MKESSLICALCLFAFFSCSEEKQSEPLPPNDKLVGIILDLHLAEGPMARVSPEQKDSIGLIVRTKIARKHGITHEYLEEIITRLQLDPVLNVQIYDSVKVRLARMQKRKSILE